MQQGRLFPALVNYSSVRQCHVHVCVCSHTPLCRPLVSHILPSEGSPTGLICSLISPDLRPAVAADPVCANENS